MKIVKAGKEIQPNHYKAYYVSQPIEGDSKKMADRYKIEQITEDTGEAYDIYDLVADLANAFNELKSGVTDGPASKKWEERQEKIKSIIG